jgi:hypothetical protein
MCLLFSVMFCSFSYVESLTKRESDYFSENFNLQLKIQETKEN